jgi:hypothetical protein
MRLIGLSLRLLLTLSGGLEMLAGLLALISPTTAVSLLLGIPVDPIAAVLTRLFGAGVFALGSACLKARNDVGSAAGLAVSLGITSYNVLAAVVLIWAAAGLDLGGLLLWAAGIGHLIFGALFVSALAASRRRGRCLGDRLARPRGDGYAFRSPRRSCVE